MFKRMTISLALLGILLISQGRGVAADIESAAQWLPADTFLVATLKQPAQVIDAWEKSPFKQALLGNPEIKKALDNPNLRQFDAVVSLLELQVKVDRWTILKKLTGGGVMLATLTRGQAVLIVQAEDAETLRQVNDFIVGLARLDAENRGQRDRVRSAEYRGVTAWSLSPDEAHAIVGNRLIVANKPELLREMIDRIQEQTPGALSGTEKFAAATQATADCNLSVYLDLEVLRAIPGAQKGLEQSREPLPVLLLAGAVTALQKAPWLALGLNIEQNQISGTVRTGPVGDWPKSFSFAIAPAEEGALPPIEVPGKLASFSFYRNLRDFYAQKNELFPERTSGLIFFENMMGIFFTGRNFTEEVLAELEPYVRLVVATQRYSPEVGTPAIQLPAFALVLRMKNPDRFKPVVEEGFQKALGLINFVRGQDAQPGLVLDRPVYKDVKYTLAYFNPEPDGDKSRVDIRFNFSPVLACRDRDLILSTAEPLAQDILDFLSQPQPAVATVQKAVTSQLQILGGQIAQLLELNKEALIAQNMAEKGHSRQAAENEIAQLMSLLRMLGNFRLTEQLRDRGTWWDFQMNLSP